MSEASQPKAVQAAPPSDVLMAHYTGDRDRARALAEGTTLSLPELAAFGNVAAVAHHLAQHPDSLHDRSPDGWTALHLAGFFGYTAVAVWLLRAGADHGAFAHNQQGNTPLHAAIAGRLEMPVVAALLAAGASATIADAQGYTPLHLAASRGDQAVTELLIACGAQRDVRTPDGRTAADIARERGHPDLSDWLQRG